MTSDRGTLGLRSFYRLEHLGITGRQKDNPAIATGSFARTDRGSYLKGLYPHTHQAGKAMHQSRSSRAFTLIELLTVIAIIAVLAALLFPIAGTVREQARATDCMTRMHQIWVACNVYKQDEGNFPPALLGYAELALPLQGNPYAGPTSGLTPLADSTSVVHGFLFREQIHDANIFHCPDDIPVSKTQITVAHWPLRPPNWPTPPAGPLTLKWPDSAYYITDPNADPNSVASSCPSDAAGVVDCWLTDGPGYKKGDPKLYYTYDSYDIGPRVDDQGRVVTINGQTVYDVHYSPNWTGVSAFWTGGVNSSGDSPIQLRYSNPPAEKTLVTYCTWHTAVGHTTTFTGISLAGQAKKLSGLDYLKFGPGIWAR